MSLSSDDLEKTAGLAHLRLPADKKDRYLQQLNDILDQVETLNQLDLETVSPLTTIVEQDQYKRDDVAVLPGDLLCENNAPSWEEGAFKVPKIKAS